MKSPALFLISVILLILSFLVAGNRVLFSKDRINLIQSSKSDQKNPLTEVSRLTDLLGASDKSLEYFLRSGYDQELFRAEVHLLLPPVYSIPVNSAKDADIKIFTYFDFAEKSGKKYLLYFAHGSGNLAESPLAEQLLNRNITLKMKMIDLRINREADILKNTVERLLNSADSQIERNFYFELEEDSVDGALASLVETPSGIDLSTLDHVLAWTLAACSLVVAVWALIYLYPVDNIPATRRSGGVSLVECALLLSLLLIICLVAVRRTSLKLACSSESSVSPGDTGVVSAYPIKISIESAPLLSDLTVALGACCSVGGFCGQTIPSDGQWHCQCYSL